MRDIGFISPAHLSQPTLRMMLDLHVFGCFWPSLSFMTFTASGTMLLCPGASALMHLGTTCTCPKQGTNELSLPSISRSGCHIWEMDPFGSGLSVNLMDQATTASRPRRDVRETLSGFNWSETHIYCTILIYHISDYILHHRWSFITHF